MNKNVTKRSATIGGLFLVFVVICFGALILGVGISTFQTHQKEVEYQNIKSTAQALTQNPPVDVKMWKAKCTSKAHSDCPWGNDPTYLFVEITNNWNGNIALMHIDPDVYCNRDIIWYHFTPEKTFSFACVGASASIDTFSQACANFMFEVSSYDPMYDHEPKPVICKNLP